MIAIFTGGRSEGDDFVIIAVVGSRTHVVFRKEWYRKTGKEVMEGRPLLHRLLGSIKRCRVRVKLKIMSLI
jgi:hypothetical protein